MIAYLDESYDPKRTVYSIAGFLSPEYLWTRFEGQWKDHLAWAGVEFFHTVQYENRLPPYDMWTPARCSELEDRLLGTIHSTITLGVGHTMVMEDYNELIAPISKTARRWAQKVPKNAKKTARGFHDIAKIYAHPYVYMLQAWMQHVSKSFPILPIGELISCVFEQNFEVQGAVRERFQSLLEITGRSSRTDFINLSRKFSPAITFAPRGGFLPLQAADLLAYEVRAEMLNKVRGDKKPEPHLLTRLFEGKRVVSVYHDKETIAADFEKRRKWLADLGHR